MPIFPSTPYLEGSWTPVLAGSTTAGAQTYSTQVGRYILVGNLVNLWGTIGITTLDGTSAGNAIITGLPFTSSNVTGLRNAISVAAYSLITMAALNTQLLARIPAASAQIDLQQSGTAVALSSLNVATGFANGSLITVGGSYRVN